MSTNEIFGILGPPLVGGLLIAVTHAPLGIEVLKRGIIFIDLAIAQIAGLGIIAAETLIHDADAYLLQIIAVFSAILAGLFFRVIEGKPKNQQEAIIGVSFVLAASLSILLLADHPRGGEKTQHLLSGQMLFVTWTDVLYHLPIYASILVAWFSHKRFRVGVLFYLLFALGITSSVQLVGVYVVFASLILPALSGVNSGKPLVNAWVCGVSSITSGILLSILIDSPTGPTLVVSYVLVAFLIFKFSGRGYKF